MNHESALKVLLIACLLEHEVLGEVLAVVAHVKPRDEDLLRPAPWQISLRLPGRGTNTTNPPHAKAPQLVIRKRIGSARIAPTHVPRVFEKHRLVALFLHLLLE